MAQKITPESAQAAIVRWRDREAARLGLNLNAFSVHIGKAVGEKNPFTGWASQLETKQMKRLPTDNLLGKIAKYMKQTHGEYEDWLLFFASDDLLKELKQKRPSSYFDSLAAYAEAIATIKNAPDEHLGQVAEVWQACFDRMYRSFNISGTPQEQAPKEKNIAPPTSLEDLREILVHYGDQIYEKVSERGAKITRDRIEEIADGDVPDLPDIYAICLYWPDTQALTMKLSFAPNTDQPDTHIFGPGTRK